MGGGADMRNRSVEEDGYVVHEIIEDEIRREICKLRSGKTSGVCGIQGEALKAGGMKGRSDPMDLLSAIY